MIAIFLEWRRLYWDWIDAEREMILTNKRKRASVDDIVLTSRIEMSAFEALYRFEHRQLATLADWQRSRLESLVAQWIIRKQEKTI